LALFQNASENVQAVETSAEQYGARNYRVRSEYMRQDGEDTRKKR